MTAELLPWIHNKFTTSHNPKDIALCGASLGGLTAFYTALNHPNLLCIIPIGFLKSQKNK
ncbi:hypothetical protein GNK04_06150 [Bacillus sp. N1-1]|nr:hypothetical protein GNK04_06150 [Bacillus sp. N1-1]